MELAGGAPGGEGRLPRTNDELDKEEDDVNYEEGYDACFARHRGGMQARGTEEKARSGKETECRL